MIRSAVAHGVFIAIDCSAEKMSAHCPVGPDDWRTRRRKLSDHGAFARAKHPCKTAYYAVPIRSTKPGPARTLLCPDRQEKWNDDYI
jgi:hypothetical protein